MTPSRSISLSVALITRNRPGSLERAIASLRAQDEQPFEIVVSDDFDEEFTSEIETIAQKFGHRYVREPRRGLYANRNSAAQYPLAKDLIGSVDVLKISMARMKSSSVMLATRIRRGNWSAKTSPP
jgi:glycosyltransferase involved in cell wall biosynthesis